MAKEPIFYLDLILEDTSAEHPAYLDYQGGNISEAAGTTLPPTTLPPTTLPPTTLPPTTLPPTTLPPTTLPPTTLPPAVVLPLMKTTDLGQSLLRRL